jgi:hypothetical protein
MQSLYCEVSNDNWITRTAAIDYLVVAGGGGSGSQGGSLTASGGGGAGGYRASGYGPSPLQGSAQNLELGTFAVTVGAGGAKAPALNNPASDGSNSILGTITSTGGGKGGKYNVSSSSGGSGGGAAINGSPGSGNAGGFTPPEGNNGGTGGPGAPDPSGGGGGGGANA